jgi:hypothetical protein
MSRIRIQRILWALATILAIPIASHAQTWKLLGAPQKPIRCEYFWDTLHGVVAGDSCIYTYNAGVWAESTYPEKPGVFNNLRLFDATHLYAVGGTTDLWVSTDRGATWQLSGAGLKDGDDVYWDKNGQVHIVDEVGGAGIQRGTTVEQQ